MAEVVQKRSDIETVTPMMQQYMDIRAQYEGFVMLYRLGDFYECFFEDAVLASRVLELTLTGRDCGGGRRAAMCGVPFHKADDYIARLVAKGYKVAICEQVEDPKEATGLVKRDVIRVVTPGTVTDGPALPPEDNNYLAAVAYGQSYIGLAFADISTGTVSVTRINVEDEGVRLPNEISAYMPAEVIINRKREECPALIRFLEENTETMITADAARLFDYQRALARIRTTFGDSAGSLTDAEQILAVGGLLAYICETQKSETNFIRDLNVYEKGQYLELDMSTRRNLDLVDSSGKERRGTLLHVLDKTRTAMGKRLLRTWVLKPLLNPIDIGHRQSATRELYKNTQLREELDEILADIFDIERLCGKAVYGSANAKDLLAIAQSIALFPRIRELLMASSCEVIAELGRGLDPLDDLYELLIRAIVDTPPLTVREGGMIREGFHADLDYYRSIRDNAKDIMHSIEEREKEETGIRTLKVDYNKVFGYYIEVSKSFVNEVPDRYVRKQTLTNCERYITQEIKEMESSIFSADEKIVDLEFRLFTELRAVVCEMSDRIRSSARGIAELDVYCSLAKVASKNNYVCPEVDYSRELFIKDGRHPVVERFVKDSYFVPNDTLLDTENNRLMLITGPNMAGKSTYMRQVALIVIMAQIGSFVPAREARVGIVDRVFTRIGASDDLASGQSTFMLEMTEVATILREATVRSLIVYDEVGRGTSTYDGMAIAKAIVEYTHSKRIGAKTLFATHYHELIALEDELAGVVNYNVAAKKRGDGVTFLRKIVRGGTDDSYGIEVAKLAGVPNEVIKRAREVLREIEGEGGKPTLAKRASTDAEPDLFTGIMMSRESELAARIRQTDVNTITPIEAMNLLYELKKLVSD